MAYEEPTPGRLQQGDVVAGIRTFAIHALPTDDEPHGSLHSYAYSVIVTQDCDLEQDFAARFPQEDKAVAPDKLLFGVILCGAHDDNLRAGRHRGGAQVFSRKEWKPVVQNKEPRYEYLGYVPQAGTTLVVDFKDYFLVPCDFLYAELGSTRARRLAQMASPYREHILQRFAWYLMRVGLPVDFDQLGVAPAPAAPGPADPSPAVK